MALNKKIAGIPASYADHADRYDKGYNALTGRGTAKDYNFDVTLTGDYLGHGDKENHFGNVYEGQVIGRDRVQHQPFGDNASRNGSSRSAGPDIPRPTADLRDDLAMEMNMKRSRRPGI